MPTCPNGHQSVADDWCEVCGHRMAGTPMPSGHMPPPRHPLRCRAAPVRPAPAATATRPGRPAAPARRARLGYGYPAPPQPDGGYQPGELCPQCRTPREAQAPFCEECRYNFLTQQPTSYAPPPPGQRGFPPPPGPPQPQGAAAGVTRVRRRRGSRGRRRPAAAAPDARRRLPGLAARPR